MIYTLKVTALPASILVPCDLAESISVGAVSDTAGAQLDFEITFLDSLGNDVGDTQPITLACGTALNWPLSTPATLYRGIPQTNPDPSFHASGVNAIVSISRVTPGSAPGTPVNWTVSVFVVFPPGVTRPM